MKFNLHREIKYRDIETDAEIKDNLKELKNRLYEYSDNLGYQIDKSGEISRVSIYTFQNDKRHFFKTIRNVNIDCSIADIRNTELVDKTIEYILENSEKYLPPEIERLTIELKDSLAPWNDRLVKTYIYKRKKENAT